MVLAKDHDRSIRVEYSNTCQDSYIFLNICQNQEIIIFDELLNTTYIGVGKHLFLNLLGITCFIFISLNCV